MVITKLKEVEKIANKYFKCIVRPIDEIHAKGYKGVKLIVGTKQNPAYDPSINPDAPDLAIEYKQNPALLANKMNPEAPDIRILWLPPGTTDTELVEFCVRIQASLKAKKPIIMKDPTMTKIETESDADLAAKVANGEKDDSRYEEWDDGYTEEGQDGPAVPTDDSTPLHNTKHEEVFADRKPTNGNENAEILEAISLLVKNMETISNDVNSINDSLIHSEERIDSLEKKDGKEVKTKPKTKPAKQK